MLPAFLGAGKDDAVDETSLTKKLFLSYQNKICVSWCPQMCWRYHGGGGKGGGLSASARPLRLGDLKKSPNVWWVTSLGKRSLLGWQGSSKPLTDGHGHVTSLPRDPWGPAHFNHVELGEIHCTPRAPKPWRLWLNREWSDSVHFVWNFLQEREIWKKFRNFQNSGKRRCWPIDRNSHTIHANAVFTTFPFVPIIPPRAGEQITLAISHTLFSFQWKQWPVILSLSAHPIMVTNRSHQIIILLITLNNASRYKLPH